MKKILDSDWLRAVQFLGNRMQKRGNNGANFSYKVQISVNRKFVVDLSRVVFSRRRLSRLTFLKALLH